MCEFDMQSKAAVSRFFNMLDITMIGYEIPEPMKHINVEYNIMVFKFVIKNFCRSVTSSFIYIALH